MHRSLQTPPSRPLHSVNAALGLFSQNNAGTIFCAVAALMLVGCATASGPAGATANSTPAEMAAGDVSAAMKPHKAPHIISTKSENDFATTLTLTKTAIEARGFKIFTSIDHAAGAASIGETLRPTTLIIFGNPRGGTKLMQAAQTIGVALPLKALVYQDAEGDVIIATSDVKHIVHEHNAEGVDALAARVAGALKAIAEEAAAKE
ncbi:MAG: DUF302 domain-containing protein [Pseudomonadota bacterium]